MTGFYMKCKTALKWVNNKLVNNKLNSYRKSKAYTE